MLYCTTEIECNNLYSIIVNLSLHWHLEMRLTFVSALKIKWNMIWIISHPSYHMIDVYLVVLSAHRATRRHVVVFYVFEIWNTFIIKLVQHRKLKSQVNVYTMDVLYRQFRRLPKIIIFQILHLWHRPYTWVAYGLRTFTEPYVWYWKVR